MRSGFPPASSRARSQTSTRFSSSPALSRPRVVCPAALRYGRPVGGKGDRPAVENRWWVDQGKDAKGNPLPRPPAAFGGRFFRTGEGFEQERARVRLTDSNLKWLEKASPPPHGWVVGHVLPRGRFPQGPLQKAKAAPRPPPRCRGLPLHPGTPPPPPP